MDEGRKRVIGIMAAILTSLHMQTADDLFGGPMGSPRTDRLKFRAVALNLLRHLLFDQELGASRWYASRIRQGYRPHPRHWEALAELVGVSAACEPIQKAT
jgi:hypothetical protein